MRPIRFDRPDVRRQRGFYLTAGVAIRRRRRPGRRPRRVRVVSARHDLGDAPRRPSLGVAVGRARREADERRAADRRRSGRSSAARAAGRLGRTAIRGRASGRGEPETAHERAVVLRLMQPARLRRGDRARQQRAAQARRVAPALGNPGPPARPTRCGTSSAAAARRRTARPSAHARCVAASRPRRRPRARSARPAPPPSSSSNSGATDAAAAIASRASGSAARIAAIAGSAITASPSQFGARMTSRRWRAHSGRRPRGSSAVAAGNMPFTVAAPARRASGGASTATDPDSAARTSRARRCSAA